MCLWMLFPIGIPLDFQRSFTRSPPSPSFFFHSENLDEDCSFDKALWNISHGGTLHRGWVDHPWCKGLEKATGPSNHCYPGAVERVSSTSTGCQVVFFLLGKGGLSFSTTDLIAKEIHQMIICFPAYDIVGVVALSNCSFCFGRGEVPTFLFKHRHVAGFRWNKWRLHQGVKVKQCLGFCSVCFVGVEEN